MLRADVNRLRQGQDSLLTAVARLEAGQDALRADVSEIKATLSQLIPMMARIDQRLFDTRRPAEFHELRGRVKEMSRRLPTTLGYTPPGGKGAA
ncbi:hypothetical protein [Azospirillum halopraeferens]|uniref:hypothetical protein n=1 Tax=Azospirillum halopraeferens TaxID=34010 RepID=UPI00040CCDF5|nr:hypothetical protein [Azospirillum halopraeferens]